MTSSRARATTAAAGGLEARTQPSSLAAPASTEVQACHIPTA
eukprot:CAMPEP_0180825648 /NCGR_PEP_ID=MMETSP1038_2-20121128/73095_1 /TAXON_ID=632150 /ORGANISM="Azadinium spinosum, Strain 3D9" /LENGTH=41 /DNA_ID= /DNA_START= /DNA_END= /DNA_ORIENTATION=